MTNEATKLIALGKNIQNARKKKKLSQNALAELLNISREHLAKIETAKRFPSLNLIFQIADVLEISEKELFDFNF
ncbi:MAG: helix-turn-helix transcriptional regulator [Candidatus Gastranaerophilales bacterium]|nr:helix-turn-helix transcriptional regulator [Candidatus Gastranaerophilales bacterium]